MNYARPLMLAVALSILFTQTAASQDLSRYRDYVLGSDVATVVAASGARPADTRTLHERPARIQQLVWRTPYFTTASAVADPVREIVFDFCDDALFQVVVHYDRRRTEGLTNDDVIESLSKVYGLPLLLPSGSDPLLPGGALPEKAIIARWDGQASTVTLLRGVYVPEFQLIVTSKALGARAREAIQESRRLDVANAPRLEAERRKQEADAAGLVLDRARAANKAAFRP